MGYIVHAVDAEGSLLADLEATFEHIMQNFDISIERIRKTIGK
ncbi:hypothetical protein OAJ77_09535 [Rhodospirillales bacterium]|nr:hypothetical protein [Rhodospirillales bacterium]